MDTIIIRDLLARGIIGLSERERARPQDILIQVEVETDIRNAAISDSIIDCIDYSELTKAILNQVENNQRQTMEALVSDIADLTLQHPLANSVKIRAEKTAAVRFTGGVGVEIIRSKQPAR